MNYEDVTELAVVVRHRRRVLLRQCQAGERWAGLWDFPRFALSAERSTAIADRLAALTGVQAEIEERLTTLKHGVTRFRITLECYTGRWVASGSGQFPIRWVTPNELLELPLSTTGREISNLLCRGKKKREQLQTGRAR